jgi:4-amino-4-deoxy-L-arabinose transferase-like glycosyltransferase
LVVLVTSALRLCGIGSDLRGPDEWRETETASIARHFSEESVPQLFWPRVTWGEPGPGYVESELQLLPLLVQPWFRWLGPKWWIGRATAVLLTALSTIVLFSLARRFGSYWTALLAALAFASCPLVFRYGRAFMPEALVLLCYLLAAERVQAWLAGVPRAMWAATVAMALAILVKPTSIHLGLVAVIWIVQQRGVRALLSPAVLAFGVLSLAPAVLWFAHAAQIHHDYGNTFGVVSGGDSKWGSWAIWRQGAFWAELLRLDVTGTVGYAGLALALVSLWSPARRSLWPWLAVILLYYAIVARYAGTENRGAQYHVYAAVPWSLAMAVGAAQLGSTLRSHARGTQALAAVAVGVLIAAMLGQQWRSNVRFLELPKRDLYVRAGTALALVSQPQDRVVVTSADAAVIDGVDNNFQEPKVFCYAWRRGRVLARDQLDLAQLEAAERAIEARWLVVLDEVLPDVAPSFAGALREAEVAVREPGFTIYRIAVRH